MSQQTQEYSLPARHPRTGEDPLIAFLESVRGKDVQICAAAVEMLDSLRLRTLLAAQKTWTKEQLNFAVINMTDSFRDGLTLLGVEQTQFDAKET